MKTEKMIGSPILSKKYGQSWGWVRKNSIKRYCVHFGNTGWWMLSITRGPKGSHSHQKTSLYTPLRPIGTKRKSNPSKNCATGIQNMSQQLDTLVKKAVVQPKEIMRKERKFHPTNCLSHLIQIYWGRMTLLLN